MSKTRMGGAAAVFVFVLVVTTGGALPSAAPTAQLAGGVEKAAGVSSLMQADKPPQEVFWERICRMLKLCG